MTVYCISRAGDIFNPRFYKHPIEHSELNYLTSYLGMTYDIIKGNPLGDPLFAVDLGYTQYVLTDKLELSSDSAGEGSASSSIHDRNGSSGRRSGSSRASYIAGKSEGVKCSKFRETSVINELRDINEEYESYMSPPQYEIYPFNGSNYYKMLVERINRGDSIIVQKVICSKYFVSLQDFNANMLDSYFRKILNGLGDNSENLGDDKYTCDVRLYKSNKYDENCMRSITPWIVFFHLYGTHLVSGVYYGGKIIHNMYVENDYIKNGIRKIKLYKKRLNPFGRYNEENNFHFGSVLSKEKIKYIRERNLMINGGEEVQYGKEKKIITGQNSQVKWKNSIDGRLAKPIKLIFIPFADFIESDDGKITYYKALEFYSKLSFSSYNPYPFQLNKSEKDLYKMHITKWNQYIDKNVNFNVFPRCKEGEKIISGFIITNKKKLYDDNNIMHMCPSSGVCSSTINIEADKNFEFGWILCSQENWHEFHQMKKLLKGNGKIVCPSKMKIGFGFSLTMQKGINTNIVIEPCKSNKKECILANADDNSQSFLWINCLPRTKQLLLQTLESKTFSQIIYINENTLVSLKCSKGKYIIAGFAVDYTPSNVEDYLICPVGSDTCDLKIRVQQVNTQEVHAPIIYIVCSSL
ncbi:perforin-like protein 5, putative [Plasmodium ovale]|uniref:Perforin-like protein 5 n=2 Tax=Plasmodium ovale TaxID=36330 RepID=A0A1A8VKR1_PLAOA|nr:perforin-like protein 5 [Plasmodium ovale curtisi]SBS82523.1 perforin-like protein 5 [Plasmodium ovale curtisi]SCA48619.1 perforin-like protein 5, putative [Plasmodium ovale]